MNKRTLQQIFDAVIDAGYYPITANKDSSNFMCIALNSAECHGFITNMEFTRAAKSIKTYMDKLCGKDGSAYLVYAWVYAGIVEREPSIIFSNKDKLLACYRDWANRPYKHRALKSIKGNTK